MSSLHQRPAVDGEARIGTFYNAREDKFLAASLFTDQPPPDATETKPIGAKSTEISSDDTYEGRFRMLGIGPGLAATLIARFVECKGVLMVMTEARSKKIDWISLTHTILTVQEKLELRCPAIKDALARHTLENVTHIVAGVEWGTRTVITARYPKPVPEEDQPKHDMLKLKAAVEVGSSLQKRMTVFNNDESASVTAPDIMAYSDVLQDAGVIMESFNEAYDFLELVPLHIRSDNGGKGQPVTYSLLPIETIAMFFGATLPTHQPLSLPTGECLHKFVKVFDEFQYWREKLSEHASYALLMNQYLDQSQIKTIEDKLERLNQNETSLKTRFQQLLSSARQSGDQKQLIKLLKIIKEGKYAPGHTAEFDTSALTAAGVLDELVSKGAVYFGNNNLDLAEELEKYSKGEAFVLYFEPKSLLQKDDPSWTLNHTRFLELLKPRRAMPTFFALYDCSSRPCDIEQPRISVFQMGQKRVEDLLSYEGFMNEKCYARCPMDTFETKDIKKPINRRFVKIPCPNKNCDHQVEHDWTCIECLTPIEYGFTDDYFYCECGRSKFSNYEFRCNESSHDCGFLRHEPAAMLKLLRNLGSSNYLNILILGETGVGKSTFINALVNYLQFETLDDALAFDSLQWAIPCSFSTQTMDRSNPNQEIEEQMVKVGSRDDEKDGSTGDSATQQTTVYPVTVSTNSTTYTVRLIDTPGIGDTRGVDFDKKNMVDILATISSYDELHGILILLKSNAARLTITFQYCVKELLVHLHQSAARNMVFGFTNTRITNYTPGDTFQPLKRLLSSNQDVGLALSINTTYCLDSESFRYLAASKNGVVMPNKQEFDRSWQHSRDETQRLVEHFRSIPPHKTQSTMSLNGARRNISELTKPMAEISQLIRKNIAYCEDQRAELKDKRLTGDKLRQNLRVQKIQLNSVPLSKPRTVCANILCTEIRDDGTGRNEKVTVYKTHCHVECYLDNVPCGVLSPPGLVDCYAFSGRQNCRKCSHRWQEHMHVLYELKESMATVTDSTVELQLKQHANDITLRQTAIVNLTNTIEEYKEELETIRQAAARFGVFLKKHSITPINDATEAYLHFLIKAEQDKVDVGASNLKLKALTEDLERHKEAVEVLVKSMNSKTNTTDLSEAGIQKTVRELYSLKHFGKNLQSLKHDITLAHQGTNREMPFSVKRSNNGNGRRPPPKLEIRNPQTFYTQTYAQAAGHSSRRSNSGTHNHEGANVGKALSLFQRTKNYWVGE